MLRFAILIHDWPVRHWDLLCEPGAGEALRAWRLDAEPLPGAEGRAEPLPAHRPVYLEYEGPVSGGRGTVTGWDRGACRWICDEPLRVVVELVGSRQAAAVELAAEGGVWRWAARPLNTGPEIG